MHLYYLRCILRGSDIQNTLSSNTGICVRFTERFSGGVASKGGPYKHRKQRALSVFAT